jgi:hypothetical protein
MLRALRLLVPLFVALGATKGASWTHENAPAQELSVRAAPDLGTIPESARTGGTSRSEVAASDAKSAQRAARAPEHHACPAPVTPVVAGARVPARATGLAAIPPSARDLAIPFYATAPPRLA